MLAAVPSRLSPRCRRDDDPQTHTGLRLPDLEGQDGSDSAEWSSPVDSYSQLRFSSSARQSSRDLAAPSDGPGRFRTCDLGIKSPSGMVATSGAKLHRAELMRVRAAASCGVMHRAETTRYSNPYSASIMRLRRKDARPPRRYVSRVERRAQVLEANLRLAAGVDPAAVGAAVTTELCGRWNHDGGCRWPHNNEIGLQGENRLTTFRTLWLASGTDDAEVRMRIKKALNESAGWTVEATRSRELRPDETALAARLARTPPPLND